MDALVVVVVVVADDSEAWGKMDERDLASVTEDKRLADWRAKLPPNERKTRGHVPRDHRNPCLWG